MIAKQTLFFTGDRKRVVPETDPEAKFLFVREGSEIADAEVEKYNAAALVDSVAEKKVAEPQQQEPPNLKEQPASSAQSATTPKVFEKPPVDGKTEKSAKAPKAKKTSKAKKK